MCLIGTEATDVSLPRLVMLSWLTSLRWATLPWLEPAHKPSSSMEVQPINVASEMANCCITPGE